MQRLTANIKQMILSFPEYRMGAHRVDLILRDGRVVEEVVVAWGDEVVRIGGADVVELPFQLESVIAARNRE